MGNCCTSTQPENTYQQNTVPIPETEKSPLISSQKPPETTLIQSEPINSDEHTPLPNDTIPNPEDTPSIKTPQKKECIINLTNNGPDSNLQPFRDKTKLTSIENLRYTIQEIINIYEPNINKNQIQLLMDKWKYYEVQLFEKLIEFYGHIMIESEKNELLNNNLLKQDFSIGTKIGSGAYATVRTGIRKRDGTEFALKIIRKRGLREKELNGLLTEIECMRIIKKSKIDHVVQLYDVYESETKLVLIMNLIKGKEIFDVIVNNGPYSEKDASIIFAQLCLALSQLHKINIVHRDIKPENLMFIDKDKSSNLVLVDFGLADSTKNGKLKEFCGTPVYIAPEMYKKKMYGVEVDMWSAGCILFILLSGRPPFDYRDDSKNLHILGKDITSLNYSMKGMENISPEAKDLITKLLTKDVSSRYTARQCLEHNWLKSASNKLISIETQNKLRRFVILRKMKKAVNVILAVERCITALKGFEELKELETRQVNIMDNIDEMNKQLDLLEEQSQSYNYIIEYKDNIDDNGNIIKKNNDDNVLKPLNEEERSNGNGVVVVNDDDSLEENNDVDDKKDVEIDNNQQEIDEDNDSNDNDKQDKMEDDKKSEIENIAETKEDKAIENEIIKKQAENELNENGKQNDEIQQ